MEGHVNENEKQFTLESMLNDPNFEKEAPTLFNMFKQELKIREPELYKQRFESVAAEPTFFESIFPIIKVGQEPVTKVKDEKGDIHEIATSAQMVIHPIFDGLGLVFGIDKGTHYEWMQNKHIESSALKISDIVDRAYSNLMTRISGKMNVHIINEGLGMLTKCNSLESSLAVVGSTWVSIADALKTTDILFSIPVQNTLFFCDIKYAENVKSLRERTLDIFNNPVHRKKISPKIYRKNGIDDIVVFAQG